MFCHERNQLTETCYTHLTISVFNSFISTSRRPVFAVLCSGAEEFKTRLT